MKPLRNKSEKETDPVATAFAVAEGLAVVAIRRWVLDCANSAERDSDYTAVYSALCANRTDPIEDIHSAIAQQISDRGELVRISDLATALLTRALDAGYVYGLAVGLAMTRGGR